MNSKLFDLIDTLSPRERAYFVTYIKWTSGGKVESHSQKLFSHICKLKTWDEDLLKKKIKDRKLVRNLANEKTKLYSHILKCMRTYSASKSVRLKFNEYLIDFQFLYQRNLFDQAKDVLKKIKTLVKKFDKPFHTILVLDLEQVLRGSTIFQESEEEINSLYKEIDHELKRAKLFNEMKRSSFLLSQETLKNKFDKLKGRRYESELTEELLENPMIKNSFNLSFILHATLYKKASYENDLEGQYKNLKLMLDLFHENPHHIEGDKIRFFGNISNYLHISILIKRTDDFLEVIDLLRRQKTNNKNEEVIKLNIIFSTQMFYYLNKGMIEEASLLIPDIEKQLEKLKTKWDLANLVTHKMNIALIHFLKENYSEASSSYLEVINIIVEKNYRQDLQSSTRLLNLIAQCELGNLDNLQNQRRNYRYFLANKYLLHDEEGTNPENSKKGRDLQEIVLDIALKYSQTPLSESKLDFFKEKLADVVALKKEGHDWSGIDEIELWLRSKTTNKSMLELVKELN